MAETVEFGQKIVKKRITLKNKFIYPPRRDGETISIRFVGSRQKIYQRWDPNAKRGTLFENNPGGNSVSERIISLVIDRSDDKIKAFLCPISVFNQIGKHDSNHCFKISREGTGLMTRYSVESLGESPVSDELKEQVEITLKTYSLVDIFVKKIKWELLTTESRAINSRFELLDL